MPNFIKNASYRSISIETKGYGGPQPTCLGDLKCPQLNNQITDAPFGSSNSRDILIGVTAVRKKQYQRTKNPKYGTAVQQFVEQVICAVTDL